MANMNSLETNPEAQQEYVTIKKLQPSKCPEFQIHTIIKQKWIWILCLFLNTSFVFINI